MFEMTKKAARLPVNATKAIAVFITANTALHLSVRYEKLLLQVAMLSKVFSLAFDQTITESAWRSRFREKVLRHAI